MNEIHAENIETATKDRRQIAVVGPCASGKTVLVERLQALGYDARQVLQEHSYVPDMWQRISKPDVLIFLDASLQTIKRRRKTSFGEKYFRELHRRLHHAAEHAHLTIPTDDLTPDEVLARVLVFLEETAQEETIESGGKDDEPNRGI